MATLIVEITDALKDRLDREVASGPCKDSSALVQMLLEMAMRSRWLEEANAKIDEAFDDVELGRVAPWTKGDSARLGRQYLADQRASKEKS